MGKGKYVWCLIVTAFAWFSASSQIITDNSVTATQAVEDILLGSGVEAFNIEFSGEENQIGSFNANGSNISIAEGVILATGNVNMASAATFGNEDETGPGGNSGGGSSLGGGNFGVGDPDLAVLSGQDLSDAAVLEFDFIPQGDSLKFEFVFGSEEYNEFVGDVYNDAFGFFLSGPNINGTFSDNAVNLALVPGTNTPITINSVNLMQNSEFFVNNENAGNDPEVIEYDGFTVSLLAEAQVECGELYHIKMVVADGFDSSFDSAVFLKASSFSSNQFQLDLVQDLGFSANDSTLYEGCGEPIITLTRPAEQSDEQILSLQISGTAQSGIDFEVIPTEITFVENQTVYELPLNIIADSEDEPLETIIITLENQAPCSGGATSTDFVVYITDVPELNVELNDANSECGSSVMLEPQISGGIGSYSYLWDDGVTDLEREVSPGFTTTYTISVSDVCTTEPVTASSIIDVPVYADMEVTGITDQTITCLESISATAQVSGGNGIYTYSWFQDGTLLGETTDITTMPLNDSEIVFTATDECGATAVGSLGISFTEFSVSIGPDQTIECLSEIELIPLIIGEDTGYTLSWNNQGNEVSTEETYSLQVIGSQTILLEAVNTCGQESEDEVNLIVNPVPISIEISPSVGICPLDSTLIITSATGGIGALEYNWVNSSESETQFYASPMSDTEYEVQITDVCGNAALASTTVFVEDLQASFSYEFISSQTAEFTNTTNLPSALQWDFNGESSSTENRPSHSFQNPFEQYIVSLVATSENGCVDSVSKVFFPPLQLFIPNAFSPDGDGLNEVFKVVASSFVDFDFKVFDRDGHLVFHGTDPDQVWNGSVNNGDYFAPDGVYNYTVVVSGLDGELVKRKGSITVLR